MKLSVIEPIREHRSFLPPPEQGPWAWISLRAILRRPNRLAASTAAEDEALGCECWVRDMNEANSNVAASSDSQRVQLAEGAMETAVARQEAILIALALAFMVAMGLVLLSPLMPV